MILYNYSPGKWSGNYHYLLLNVVNSSDDGRNGVYTKTGRRSKMIPGDKVILFKDKSCSVNKVKYYHVYVIRTSATGLVRAKHIEKNDSCFNELKSF